MVKATSKKVDSFISPLSRMQGIRDRMRGTVDTDGSRLAGAVGRASSGSDIASAPADSRLAGAMDQVGKGIGSGIMDRRNALQDYINPSEGSSDTTSFQKLPYQTPSSEETFQKLPYQVPSDSGMPANNFRRPPPDMSKVVMDGDSASGMRDVMRFGRMGDIMSRLERPAIAQSYKRGGYVSKDGKLNLGSGRSTTAAKNKKSSNW